MVIYNDASRHVHAGLHIEQRLAFDGGTSHHLQQHAASVRNFYIHIFGSLIVAMSIIYLCKIEKKKVS